jgi:tripartite-type tricarboxylate transporter receptor subunit TctC
MDKAAQEPPHNGGTMKRRPSLLLLTVLLSVMACGAIQAQSYPAKPIRMVVGFPPGGGTDVVARILAPKLSENLGQSVIIDNRPGATGTVAAGMVAKSPADGYTIMMGHVSVNAIAPSLFSKLPYDVEKDFAAVTLAASVPHLVTVHPSLPVSSVKELIAFAKANAEKLSFPSAGNGSTPHLAGEMFKSATGVNLLHVPYKGTGQSMQDLIGGFHQVAFDTMPASSPYVRSRRLRLLAVTSARRLSEFPNAPTVAEAGVPGYHMTTWYGIFAPASTPPGIVNLLHAETAKVMQTPDVRERLAEVGADETVTRTPAEFAAIVRTDTARYAKIVKQAGLRID